MATFTRVLLSGSTNGAPQKIAATGSPGDTVHTAVAGTAGMDEVYLWVTNTDSSPRTVTIQFGGVTDPDFSIVKTLSIPANSPPIPVLTGQNLQNGLLVKVFASLTNVLLVTGYVNRIA